MSGFLDSNPQNRFVTQLYKNLSRIGKFGMQYEDMVLRNSQTIGQTESQMFSEEGTGFTNDSAFYWTLGYQDTRIRKKYTEEFIFKENSEVSNKVVKNRLMSNPTYEHKCELCSVKEWYDPFEKKIKPVNLELDHINGNERDNRKKNLRLICSNCHSFTPTYKGRNINGGIRKGENKISDIVLLEHLKTKNIRQSLISVGMSASGENYQRCKILKKQLTSEENVVR